METITSVCLGIGLSAACGFRVFVPLLFMSIASMGGHLSLAHGLKWIATYPALITFAVATCLEIGELLHPLARSSVGYRSHTCGHHCWNCYHRRDGNQHQPHVEMVPGHYRGRRRRWAGAGNHRCGARYLHAGNRRSGKSNLRYH